MVSDKYSEKERYADGHRVIWLNSEWGEYSQQINSKLLRREMAKIGARSEGEAGCSNDTCELPKIKENGNEEIAGTYGAIVDAIADSILS
jgi:hypothetical protein